MNLVSKFTLNFIIYNNNYFVIKIVYINFMFGVYIILYYYFFFGDICSILLLENKCFAYINQCFNIVFLKNYVITCDSLIFLRTVKYENDAFSTYNYFSKCETFILYLHIFKIFFILLYNFPMSKCKIFLL